jgi:stage III sporulation protein AE
MKSVQDAVEKALSKSEISDSYSFNSADILRDALKGMPMENLKGLPKVLLSVLGNEIKANLALLLELFAIMLLGAVVRSLQPLEAGIPNEAAKLGVNGVMIVIAAVSFGSIVSVVEKTIESMQHIASIAMPALIALMASSGRIVSVTALQPIMLIGVNTACHILKTVLLPIAVMAGLLFLVDSLSERFKLKTIAKLLKSCAVWLTGALTLVFSIMVSIQKLASSSVDAVAIKTAKFAVGTFIPVAGKYMSDAAETILVCTSAARNAAGILTVIGLGLIFLIPFIKVFIIMLCFRLAAAFGSPICDESICDSLEDSASCLSVILGIMGSSLFVLVLLTGTLMSSSGFMQ